MDILWILLPLLLIAAGAAFWVRRGGAAPPRPSAPVGPEDDLRSLGLSPARPRSAEPAGEGSRPALPRAEPMRAHEAEPIDPQAVLRDGVWEPHAGVVEPLLTAFATAVGGPVAVLSVRDEVASVDALAEAGAVPRLPQRRLSASSTGALQRTATESFATSGEAADALLAFRSAGIPAPARAAACQLSGGRLVVAGGELDEPALTLADRFADLLDALAGIAPDAEPARADDRPPAAEPSAEAEARPVPPVEEDGAAADAATDAEAEAPDRQPETDPPPVAAASDAPVQPGGVRRAGKPMSRTALLAAEIASSREAEQPLAFALVTRADVESALAGGDPEAATAALCDELRAHDAVRRVEPFGDLVAGVFLDADALEASRWTRALVGHEPPLRLGMVAPADYDAAGVRADAESALAEAWAEGELVVVSG